MKVTTETVSLRAAPSAYGTAAAMLGVPLLIALAAAVRQPVMWVPVTMCGAAILGCWLWLRKYSVELNGEGVRCEELFRHTLTIRLSEIDRFGFEGPARLVIHPTSSSGKPALVIRMKVFRLHDFRQFVAALEGRLVARARILGSASTRTIFIPLLDEGTSVARPTEGVPLGRDLYQVLETPNYDPEDEHWEFPPGSIVRCFLEAKPEGPILVARELASGA